MADGPFAARLAARAAASASLPGPPAAAASLAVAAPPGPPAAAASLAVAAPPGPAAPSLAKAAPSSPAGAAAPADAERAAAMARHPANGPGGRRGTGAGAGSRPPATLSVPGRAGGDGVTLVIEPGGSRAFLADRTVRALDRPELSEVLERLGIRTLGGLAALPAADVAGRFGAEGIAAHRLARGLDERPPATRPPPPDLAVMAELDPPAERLEAAAFVARGLADDLAARLATRGSACTRVVVGAETEHGERHERVWRTEGTFTPMAIADRVRWQVDGWLHGANRPTAGLTRLWLAPDEVVPAGGRQLAFSAGGPGAVDAVEAADRAARALARVQGIAGIEAVNVVEWRGGRGPGERVRTVPAAAVDVTEPRPSARVDWVPEPWPGQAPRPSPALTHAVPPPADVLDAAGRPVTVSGRGEASGAPVTVRIPDLAAQPMAVQGWAALAVRRTVVGRRRVAAPRPHPGGAGRRLGPPAHRRGRPLERRGHLRLTSGPLSSGPTTPAEQGSGGAVPMVLGLADSTVSLLVGVISGLIAITSLAWQARTQRRQREEDRAAEAERIVRRYTEPLVYAPDQLLTASATSRTRVPRQWGQTRPRARGRETAFTIAELLGWMELLRQDQQFVGLGEEDSTRRSTSAWPARRPGLRLQPVQAAEGSPAPFMLWRHDQRAIGELMIVRAEDAAAAWATPASPPAGATTTSAAGSRRSRRHRGHDRRQHTGPAPAAALRDAPRACSTTSTRARSASHADPRPRWRPGQRSDEVSRGSWPTRRRTYQNSIITEAKSWTEAPT